MGPHPPRPERWRWVPVLECCMATADECLVQDPLAPEALKRQRLVDGLSHGVKESSVPMIPRMPLWELAAGAGGLSIGCR